MYSSLRIPREKFYTHIYFSCRFDIIILLKIHIVLSVKRSNIRLRQISFLGGKLGYEFPVFIMPFRPFNLRLKRKLIPSFRFLFYIPKVSTFSRMKGGKGVCSPKPFKNQTFEKLRR